MNSKFSSVVDLGIRPKVLLLDAGDTLVFFDPLAVAAVLHAAGVELEPSRIEAALFHAKRHYQQQLALGAKHIDGWSLLICDLLERAGLEASEARRVLPTLRAAHAEFNFWRRVAPGVPAALARARAAGMRLGIISNSEGRLRALFERLGLLSYFEVIVDSQLEGVQKPDPEIFRRGLARMDVTAEYALYAGDIPEIDVRGANGVGMNAVLIDTLDEYRDQPEWVRVPSVAALIDALLLLPVQA